MLVLSRKLNQAIIIDGDIRVTVVNVHGNQIRLGIQAPESVRVFREELCGRTTSRKNDHRLAPAADADGPVMPYSTEVPPRGTPHRNS